MADTGFRGLRITNTLTRLKEDFVPADPANVRMYVCGPTVYDYAHIGNARPAIVFDVLFRLLRHLYGSEHVTYVRNITDVDDKINARALRDFGTEIEAGRMTLNEAIRQVTERTYQQYHKDVAALGCLPPTREPRATEHIAGMVAMIQDLIDRGHAYVAAGPEGREVLFETGSMAEYGELSKRRLEDQQAGARIDVKDHKRAPSDFVLWKESSATEPGWEGAFTFEGKPVAIHGRPGWHIECSVMSKAFLGETFDIHGGGLDLIFPHHENEIAQSRCAHGTATMAKYWMHNGFLQVEGRKMSKSEGNFVTIHDLLETETFGGRAWPGEVLRLAMLMTHYREPIDFSVRRLEEAGNVLAKLQRRVGEADAGAVDDVLDALQDDLNVTAALAAMNAMGGKPLADSLALLGLPAAAQAGVDEADIAAAVEKRLAFIREKNWAEADRIRDDLLGQGIQLKDGKDPATGDRITTWEVKR
ncbi:cysteine--tRNA ligase [Zhengella mangrovi]|uniref:Cysteine--tRNA ligase n=1 Tax=Zhengella mangrovi TaxID=1982044 RepID=A0A2G1QS45_9HYPH|nr:cysteine--tRNA ligase [Zhengella mangrovi]PHP68274.1 cysteine--tRNA ligase [Zhengella mangrovi]